MHNACMPSVTIRDVPQETRNILAARAAKSGRSLQEYLKAQLVEWAERPSPDEVFERMRARKRRAPITVSTDEILGHIDGDRR